MINQSAETKGAREEDSTCKKLGTCDESNTCDAPAWARFTNVPFRLLGYGILMGWHFLLIYFFVSAEAGPELDVLFIRQMALNTTLAVTFALLAVLGLKAQLPTRLLSTPSILGVALAGALSTAGALCAAFTETFSAMMLLTAIAGIAEAVLLLAWLHFYSESSTDYATHYIALSMVIGALVAFFIRHLSLHVALACFVALPFLSAAMLVCSIWQTPARSAIRGERGLSDHEGALRPLLTNTAYLAVYSAAFGFLQGSVLPDGETLLAAFTPNTVIGAALAGALTLLAHRKIHGKRASELLRRFALFLIVIGVLLTAYPWPAAKEVAGMTIMMGFITTDITCLVFVVRLIRAYDLSSAFVIGLNRAVEYAAFALAIICGSSLANLYGSDAFYAIIVSGVTVVIVLGYTLATMGQGPLDWISQLYPVQNDEHWDNGETGNDHLQNERKTFDANDETASTPAVGRFKLKCRLVCSESGLSPRESEVFMLMAKGRNAEYIQGALTISNYTAKTHIANIYRKVGVHSLQELIDTVEQASVSPDESTQ